MILFDIASVDNDVHLISYNIIAAEKETNPMPKSKRKPISLRIPEAMKEWLDSKAKANERSVNSEIVLLLKTAMQADEHQGNAA